MNNLFSHYETSVLQLDNQCDHKLYNNFLIKYNTSQLTPCQQFVVQFTIQIALQRKKQCGLQCNNKLINNVKRNLL